jgi:hypothetical protein
VTCEKCGATLAIGDFPFCPHGRYRGNTESDGIPGGETLENVGPEPVTFYSRSEKRRYLKEHGLVEMVRHVPVPGTDTSPHTTSWTGVNLEAGRILAERQAQTKASTTPHRANPETIAIIKQFYEEHYARHGRD